MSDNKYIIDKDSLTGIADAVRDKLGNGAAITDEDAGYYPVPIKKLGYFQKADTASYSQGSGYTSSNSIYERPVSELVNICGIRPSYIKVTVTNSSGFDTRDIIYRFTNVNSPGTSRVDSGYFDAKRTAILSIPSDIDDCYIEYGGYYSSYSTQYSTRDIPAYDVVFLDSNQNEININEYSGDSFPINQWGTTKSFLTKTSFEKIPYSIDDIQNKITNYLNAFSAPNAPKIALLSNFYVGGTRNSSFTSLKAYGGFSNIFLIVGNNGSHFAYLDMVNHPNKIGTYNGYDTYRFYQHYNGAESTLMDVQHNTFNGADNLYQMTGSYGLTLSPCFIIYKEATE